MFKFLERYKHDFKVIAAIGGDTQAYACQCKKCGKKKVEVFGRNGKPDFDYIVKYGKKYR